MMNSKFWYSELLMCPDCTSKLQFKSNGVACSQCDFFNSTSNDLRPQKQSSSQIQFPKILSDPILQSIDKIDIFPPPITYQGPNAIRDSRAFMSIIMNYLKEPGKVLDLGCGAKDQFIPISHLGHNYVGIDYTNPAADYLGDAHSIPFKESSFDCVLSYAVLEHLHNPYIAIQEVSRVLKSGGIFIGSVSQGEPFHSSFFHLTSWGLFSLVNTVPSLEIKRLWGSRDTLAALSTMGRYPRVIRAMLLQMDKLHKNLPILSPRKMQWSDKDKNLDSIHRAGSICFVIEKH